MSKPSNYYVITVRFQLRPGAEESFHDLVNENAAASVRDEPGCLLFDVLVPRDSSAGSYVLLYEIYTSRAALDHHVTTNHYRDFDAASRALIVHKEVREFTLFHHRAGNSDLMRSL